jgi:hypothetical protein
MEEDMSQTPSSHSIWQYVRDNLTGNKVKIIAFVLAIISPIFAFWSTLPDGVKLSLLLPSEKVTVEGIRLYESKGDDKSRIQLLILNPLKVEKVVNQIVLRAEWDQSFTKATAVATFEYDISHEVIVSSNKQGVLSHILRASAPEVGVEGFSTLARWELGFIAGTYDDIYQEIELDVQLVLAPNKITVINVDIPIKFETKHISNWTGKEFSSETKSIFIYPWFREDKGIYPGYFLGRVVTVYGKLLGPKWISLKANVQASGLVASINKKIDNPLYAMYEDDIKKAIADKSKKQGQQ